jgi:multicomponent Na+:H+ antiporter subunit E
LKNVFRLNTALQFALLLGLWLLISGHYDFFHISMGALSAFAVVLLHIPLRKHYHREELEAVNQNGKDHSGVHLHFGRALAYIPWLIWQIILAALQVASVVLRPRMPIDPALIRFKTNYPNTSGKVLLGNSITLTPGTITIQIREDEFLVHALMDASASGILDDSMPIKAARIHQKEPGPVISDVKIIRSGADI